MYFYATIAILIVSVGVAIWVAAAFVHSHQNFLKRKADYAALAQRITRGEAVEPSAMACLIPQDRLMLQFLQAERQKELAEAELIRERQRVAEPAKTIGEPESFADILARLPTGQATKESQERRSGAQDYQ